MGDDAVGDNFELVEEVGVGAVVSEGEVVFCEVVFGFGEGGFVALAETVDGEGEGVDAGLLESVGVFGEFGEAGIAGGAPTGPEGEEERAAFVRDYGLFLVGVVEEVNFRDRHGSAEADGGAGGGAGELEFFFGEIDDTFWRSPRGGFSGALGEVEPGVGFEVGEGFGFSAGPVDGERGDVFGGAEAEVEPFAGLAEEAFAGAEAAEEGAVAGLQNDAGADSVAV